MVEKDVEGVELSVEEGVEGIGLSIEEEVDSWLSFSIFSFSLFMYVSCDFLPRSCLLGSFVTSSDFCSCYLKAQGKKVETNMAPFFKYPVFDLAGEKVKRVIRQLEKPHETLENSLYT